jgi:hypothetical protein
VRFDCGVGKETVQSSLGLIMRPVSHHVAG